MPIYRVVAYCNFIMPTILLKFKFFFIAMLVPLYIMIMLFIHPRSELETLSFTESVSCRLVCLLFLMHCYNTAVALSRHTFCQSVIFYMKFQNTLIIGDTNDNSRGIRISFFILSRLVSMPLNLLTCEKARF